MPKAKARTPKLRDDTESNSHTISLCVTGSARERIAREAESRAWSVSQYVRACVLACWDQQVTVWPRYKEAE